MDELIEQNYLPFQDGIDFDPINQTEHSHPWIVRLAVVDNQVHGPAGAARSMLEYLTQTYGLPDLDFLYLQQDGIGQQIPGGAPIFCSSKQEWVSQGLYFVDWYTNMPHPSWDDMVLRINRVLSNLRWEDRRDLLIWRGSTTDGYYDPGNWTSYTRGKLCALSLRYPNLIDARFASICPFTCSDTQQVARYVPTAPLMSLEEQVHYKYQIICDGIFATFPGDRWRLLSDSVCFKPDSTFGQWFYGALIPWTHYVPVKKDLSDLLEKFTYVKSNPSLARELAKNARDFALNSLLSKDIAVYCYKTLMKYASLQKFNVKEKRLVKLVEDSLKKAEKGESKLSPGVLSIDGMSGAQTRYLLNHLCSGPHVNYLEIGCWKGSTLISALYGNQAQATAIDNWSQFDNQRSAFYSNIGQFIPNARLNIYEEDCFSMDKAIIPPKVNVYFYDGNHAEKYQELAFTYFDDVFDDVFIAVIDDWNWERVQRATRSVFKKLNYAILFEKSLLTDWNGNLGTWWNGIYIAVIKKSGSND
jgi:hypothetical protein